MQRTKEKKQTKKQNKVQYVSFHSSLARLQCPRPGIACTSALLFCLCHFPYLSSRGLLAAPFDTFLSRDKCRDWRATWQCRRRAIVKAAVPALPSAIPTALSRMNEQCVVTHAATLSHTRLPRPLLKLSPWLCRRSWVCQWRVDNLFDLIHDNISYLLPLESNYNFYQCLTIWQAQVTTATLVDAR